MFTFLQRDPRGKRNLFTWEADFELPVKAVLERLMADGAVNDVPIDVLVAACADLVAMSAARLDAQGGQCTINDRLQAFCERVEKKYRDLKVSLKKNQTPWGKPLNQVRKERPKRVR